MKYILLVAAICFTTTAFCQPSFRDGVTDGTNQLNIGHYSQAITILTNAINSYYADDKKLMAVAYCRRAEAEIALKQYYNAIADCNRALNFDTKQYEAYVIRAQAETANGDIDLAAKDAELVIEKGAANPGALCKAYLCKAKAAYAGNNITDCVHACNHILAIDSNFKQTYWLLGDAFAANKQYDAALSNYNDAILHYSAAGDTFKNDLASIYVSRGGVYYTQKKYDKSLADDSMAMLLNPASGPPYWNRGLVYDKLKKYSRAQADFSKAIPYYKTQNNALATLYTNVGNMLNERNQYGKAIVYYDSALALKPGDSYALVGEGNSYRWSKNYRLAIDRYNKAIQSVKDDNTKVASIYTYISYCHEDMRMYRKAINDDSMAIILDFESGNAYWEQARCYDKLEKFKTATDAINKAITLLKTDSVSLQRAYCWRGHILAHQKQFKKAIDDYNLAKTFVPTNGLPYLYIGNALFDSCQYTSAIDQFNKAIELYKDDSSNVASAYDDIAGCHYHLRQYQQAVDDENKSISFDSTNQGPFYQRGRDYLLLNNTAQANADFKNAARLDTSSTTFGMATYFLGDSAAAIKFLKRKIQFYAAMPLQRSWQYYDLACLLAQMNKPDDAVFYLKKSLAGAVTPAFIATDADLDPIRNTPQFAGVGK